jgi:hypothetical protein
MLSMVMVVGSKQKLDQSGWQAQKHLCERQWSYATVGSPSATVLKQFYVEILLGSTATALSS